MLCSVLTIKLTGEIPGRRYLSQIHPAGFAVFVSILEEIRGVDLVVFMDFLVAHSVLSAFLFFPSSQKRKRKGLGFCMIAPFFM